MNRTDALADLAALSERQTDVLIFCAKGCDVRETSRLTGLTENTVTEYRRRISRKLGVNMYAASAMAAAAGLL